MDFPHGLDPEKAIVISGSGTRFPGFYPIVPHFKYVIGGLHTSASYEYIDSALTDMRNYVISSNVTCAIVSVPRHFLGDVLIFLKGTYISDVWIYDQAKGILSEIKHN